MKRYSAPLTTLKPPGALSPLKAHSILNTGDFFACNSHCVLICVCLFLILEYTPPYVPCSWCLSIPLLRIYLMYFWHVIHPICTGVQRKLDISQQVMGGALEIIYGTVFVPYAKYFFCFQDATKYDKTLRNPAVNQPRNKPSVRNSTSWFLFLRLFFWHLIL